MLEYDIRHIRIFSQDIEQVYVSQFQSDLKQEFLENFQVSTLAHLLSLNSQESTFEFSKIGTVRLEEYSVGFSLNRNGIAELQHLYNVVYLESPIYFKLKRH